VPLDTNGAGGVCDKGRLGSCSRRRPGLLARRCARIINGAGNGWSTVRRTDGPTDHHARPRHRSPGSSVPRIPCSVAASTTALAKVGTRPRRARSRATLGPRRRPGRPGGATASAKQARSDACVGRSVRSSTGGATEATKVRGAPIAAGAPGPREAGPPRDCPGDGGAGAGDAAAPASMMDSSPGVDRMRRTRRPVPGAPSRAG
jgi:hypothetical protein